MTIVLAYLIAAYAALTECIHQNGAIMNAYSDLKPIGSPRRAAWPVAAIAREICVHSNSSVAIVGVRLIDASQRRSDRSASAAIANGRTAR